MTLIRFRFSPQKAFTALHWMVNDHPGIDLHAGLKACYFADKEHLNTHYRPIFGATYRAMKFGPVPLEIYEMAKGEAIWLAELGIEQMPWHLRGYRLARADNQPQENREAFSETEIECFARGLERSLAMDFNERTDVTHGRDWQRANLGIMKYEDMINDGPEKEEIIDYLRETARFMKI